MSGSTGTTDGHAQKTPDAKTASLLFLSWTVPLFPLPRACCSDALNLAGAAPVRRAEIISGDALFSRGFLLNAFLFFCFLLCFLLGEEFHGECNVVCLAAKRKDTQ